MKEIIQINGRCIGKNEPPYIIAEISGNHNGELAKAISLVEAAADAGVDAVKLQTYTADTITLNVNRPEFKISGGLWDGKNLYDLYSEASTPWEWHEELFRVAKAKGIDCFSSPFDPTAVDFLEKLDVPAYKIASFELVDIPLIEKVSSKGKPIIMSTGIANDIEIEEACISANKFGADGYALLHCISEYPTQPKDMNLQVIKKLKDKFKVPVGLSDHTLGSNVAIAAVALGACIIEKHITLKREDGGPDAAFSMEPNEFKSLVNDCQTIYSAIKNSASSGIGTQKANAIFRRSLFVIKDILIGEFFSLDNVRSIRPGAGIAPKYLNQVIGQSATRSIKKGEPLDWGMISKE